MGCETLDVRRRDVVSRGLSRVPEAFGLFDVGDRSTGRDLKERVDGELDTRSSAQTPTTRWRFEWSRA